MRIITCIAMLLMASTGYAQDDGWFYVLTSKDDNNTYSIKLGSSERSQNKNGEPMTVVVGKSTDKKLGTIEIRKWYVTDADCAQEYGNFVVLNVDGTYNFETSFAKGSKNIASGIAENICAITSYEQKKADGKGI